jgi:activator of HSP90 ATPase
LKSRNDVRVVKAEADHAVARQRCEDLAGNAKDVCIKEATAVETAAKADAKAQLTTSNAKAAASEKSSTAFSKANAEAATARKEAAKATNDAQYDVAVEKCDVYAGGAKDVCLGRAKARFGKS